jgi:hypothetical protein
MEKPCRTHLLSSECNHYAYDKAPTLAYPFHELDTEASLAFVRYILTLWITLVHLKANKVPCVLNRVHIKGHGRPMKYTIRFFLSEFSYNASYKRFGVIIHKIIMSAKGSLSKWGTTCTLSTWSWYATPFKLHCQACKSSLELKGKHLRELHRRHRTLLYPSRSLLAMQCFYAARLKRDDRLSSDQLWILKWSWSRIRRLLWLFYGLPYICLTHTIQLILNTSWYTGLLAYPLYV